MQARHVLLGAAACAALTFALSPAAAPAAAGNRAGAAPAYEIVDLGDFGGELANAHSLNDAGEVVGTAEDPNLSPLPFLWRDGTLTDIGTLLPGRKHGHGIARAISANGYVAGYSMAPYPDGPGSVSHAFFWSEQGGMIDLTPNTGIMSGAWGVNSAGQVVGEIAGQAGGAFLWTQAGGITMLSLPGAPAGYGGTAEDVSETGLVCGHQWNANFDYVGWIYDSASGQIRELGNIGRARSETRSINRAGEVVGVSTRENYQRRPVLWETDGNIVDLGLLPVPDFTQGTAEAINDQRWVVGEDDYDGNGVPTKGWLWVEGSKYELRELIADAAQRAHWDELTAPLDINNRGEIVGIGIRDGIQGRAFLMRLLPADAIFADGFD
jgi:probable HAF family extracellular repeat protein